MKQLAIVIPAYKIDFFRETLESLASQTCKDFTVYIGEDCSPNDFESIISDFKNSLDIRYVRFLSNLGGSDLVAQWERCLDLTEGEPWLWLFSDDDVIGKHCVELFYKHISSVENVADIYHFDVNIIDERGNLISKSRKYPHVISVEDFFMKKEAAKIDSFVVEYIFSRKIYNEVHGFQNFPLAWGSDIATWIKMGKEKGIETIEGDNVYWRTSSKNITPNLGKDMAFRKFNINIEYIKWVNNFFKTPKIIHFNQYHLLRLTVHYCLILEKNQINDVLSKAVSEKILSNSKKVFILNMLPLFRIGKRLKTLL